MSTDSGVPDFKKRLTVKVTVGAENPEKLSQAFTVTSAAAVSGFATSLWLTGEASWLAFPGRAEEFALEGAKPLSEMLQSILANGPVTLCSQCAARRNLTEDQLIPGITIKGASSFVEEIMTVGTESLVY